MLKYAMDCEMVGGFRRRSILARVTIVDENGSKVFDEYVRPISIVTDYRYFVSGIKRRHLANGKNINVVRERVANILRGNLLIGHSIHFDLEVLGIEHPEKDQRDLSKYKPLLWLSKNGQPVTLKTIAKHCLGRNIQVYTHDSLEDAITCMDIYNKLDFEHFEWEEM